MKPETAYSKTTKVRSAHARGTKNRTGGRRRLSGAITYDQSELTYDDIPVNYDGQSKFHRGHDNFAKTTKPETGYAAT
jgi:hypothetical protein